VTTLTSKEVSFSANACVKHRYVSCRWPRQGPKRGLSLLSGAVAQNCTLGHDSSSQESAENTLPSGRLPARTQRMFCCQEALKPRLASQTSIHILPRKGGAPEVLCRLKTTEDLR
jgi:hypothetical protein